jgi:hypothetical protein
MTLLLKTLHRDCSVGEACSHMELSESHFHALRHQWLQRALQLFEPRTPGQRPKDRSQQAERVEQSEQEVRDLRRELALTKARCEVMEALGPGTSVPVKRGLSVS